MAKKVAPKRTDKSAVKASGKITQAGVISWNKWLALAFGVQAIAILLFSEVHSFPITINYLGLDTLQTNAQGKTVLATGSQTLFNLNLAYVVAAFLLAGAIMHALLASRLQSKYEQDLKKNINSYRWIEYAVSSGLMVVAVSLIAGVQDISSLVMIFGLVALMNVLLLFTESKIHIGQSYWSLFYTGCATGLLAWIAIKLYLLGGTVYGSVPAYVYWIVSLAFVLFVCVPVNQFLIMRKVGAWKNYLYGERIYMLVSLAAKTLVAWLLYVAILRP